jgi:hypothetical protein
LSPPRNDCAGRLGGQPARGSRYEKEESPKDTKSRQLYLWAQIQSLREAALAHRRRADRTEGEEHELAYREWTDLRFQIARLVAEWRLA